MYHDLIGQESEKGCNNRHRFWPYQENQYWEKKSFDKKIFDVEVCDSLKNGLTVFPKNSKEI